MNAILIFILYFICLPIFASQEQNTTICHRPLECPNFWNNSSLSHQQENSTIKYFYQPKLHDCFHEHEYDTSQLPLLVDQEIHPIKIIYHFSFNNLIELAESGEFTFLANLGLSWHDENRCWNTSTYPVDIIFVELSEIWTPKFLLVNARSNDLVVEPKNSTRVILDSSGDVTMKIHKMFETTCDMNLIMFPFDTQKCEVLFSLMHYTTDEVILSSIDNVMESFFQNDGEWTIKSIADVPMNFTPRVYNKTRNGEVIFDSYQNYIYNNTGFKVTMKFERQFEYYIHYIIAPICILALLGYLAVLLKAESADRLNLSTTVMLGFLFMQSTIASLIPKSDNSPLIAKYVLGCMILQSSNVIFSAAMMWIAQMQTPMSPFIDSICYGLTHPLRTLKFERKRNTIKNKGNFEDKKSEENIILEGLESNGLPRDKEKRESKDDKVGKWKYLIIALNRLYSFLFLIISFFLVKYFLFPMISSF